MKFADNGLLYDTEKATLVLEVDSCVGMEDTQSTIVRYYATPNGNYFMVESYRARRTFFGRIVPEREVWHRVVSLNELQKESVKSGVKIVGEFPKPREA